MLEITNKSQCCGCSACFNACPKQCISMVQDEEGFLYPKVDTNNCINCGLCEKVCLFNKEEPKRNNIPPTFAVKIKNDELRLKASSGGVFPILANEVLNNGGIVYGVAMSENCKSALHIRVDNKIDLAKLFGSKYLQSNINNVFQQVKQDLKENKQVLFSGVPCQIDGLKLFLGKEYDNLLSVEVICHGVPSPLLWKKYCEYLESKNNGTIKKVNFREKKNGWGNFGLQQEGENIYQFLRASEDPFLMMFLRNYCLRPSCYNCNAKKLESMADITIADFWGIENVAPEMFDDKGVSLVLLQSEKGKKVFNKLCDNYDAKEVPFLSGIKSNMCYNQSVIRPNERDSFFINMNQLTFHELQDKYCKKIKLSFVKKLYIFIKKVVKRIFHRGGVNYNRFEYGLLIVLRNEKN